ncbi:MAG: elongation factor Ts, partial [Candidatus Omnitrophota bacterium]
LRQEVPAEVIEREKAVYREEIKGKPENIVEKIMQGKLEKFYQGCCFPEQIYIKNDKQTVRQLIDETSKTLGDSIQIKQFVRWQLGEAIVSN